MDTIYATDGVENKLGVLQPNGHFSYIGQDVGSLSELPASVNGHLVKRLDLSFNLLTSLEGLERFDNLEELIVDSNQLGDDIKFPLLHRLHTLMLNKNNITILSSLLEQITEKFPQLTYLSLLGNEACPNQLSDPEKTERDYKRYRQTVIYHLPNLRFLDATPVKEAEYRQAQAYGKQFEAIRPQILSPGISVDDPSPANVDQPTMYNPLPSETHPRHHNGQKATFSKCKYVYYGKHSEGNRFIRNNDL